MKLVCPCCGATVSLEAWENDAAVRQFVAALTSLPHPVRELAPRYLGLFRKGERGLAWNRALRLIQALDELIGSGTVHWDGGETRPAPPALWAEAMTGMLDRGLKELEDHNYLRKVVWTKARELASRAESERETSRRRRTDEPPEQDDRPSDEERFAVKKMMEDFTKNFGRYGTSGQKR